MSLKVLSFFSGIGGFDAAFLAAGHRVVGACEIDDAARKVYAARFGEPAWFPRDVAAVTPDEVPHADAWVGGPPCQSFSVAGARGGMDDHRGNLFAVLLDLAAQRRPQLLVLENVPGLLSSSNGRDFGGLLAQMLRSTYRVAWATLDARHFGVAQRRRRVFICASLVGDPRAILFDAGVAPRSSGAPDAVLRDGAWTSPQAGLFGTGDAPFAGASWPTSGYAAGERCWTRSDDEEREGSARASLSDTLERGSVHPRFYLSPKACAGILRRAARRGRDLPPALAAALMATAEGTDAKVQADPRTFESRFARNGRGAPSDVVAALKAQAGSDGRGDASPLVTGFYPTGGTRDVQASADESPALKVGSGVGIPSAPAVVLDSASALQGGGQRGHRIDAEDAAGGQLVVAPLFVHANKGRPAGRQSAHEPDVHVEDHVSTLATDGHAQSALFVPETSPSLRASDGGDRNDFRLRRDGMDPLVVDAAAPRDDDRRALAFDWQSGSDGDGDDSFRGKSRKWVVRAGDYAGSLGATKRDAVADLAPTIRAADGHHGRSSPRGDGADALVVDDVANSLRAAEGPHGHSWGMRGDGTDTFVIEGDSAASTPDLPRLRAGCGRGGETSVVVAGQQHGSDVGSMGALRAGRGDVQSGVPFVVQAICEGAHGTTLTDEAVALQGEGGKPGQGYAAVLSFGENQRGEVVMKDDAPALGTGGGKPGSGYAAVLAVESPGRKMSGGARTGDGVKTDEAYALDSDPRVQAVVAFQADASSTAYGVQPSSEVSPTLDVGKRVAVAGFNQKAESGKGGNGYEEGVAPPLRVENPGAVVAFGSKDRGADIGADSPTLRASPHDKSHANGGAPPAVHGAGAIRRLTASECEALQGGAHGWTCTCGVECRKPDDRRIPAWWPAEVAMGGCGHASCGCECSDGPRYRQLGNSVAVPVVNWIARRLA